MAAPSSPSSLNRASGRRGRRRVLVALLASVLLILVASFIVGHLDASALKPRIEAAFERATGRKLQLGGKLRFSLLPSPGFAADDVRIANLPGGSRPDMIIAERIVARIDLFALLGRDLHVESVSLVHPDILLETVHGEPNWRFHPQTSNAPSTAGAAPHTPIRLDFNEVDAAGGHLVWRDLGRAGSGDIGLDRVRVEQQDRSSFTFFAAAHHRDTPFTVSLASAPPQALLDGNGTPIPFRVKLTLGHDENGDRAEFDGKLSANGSLDGQLHADLPQLADLNGLFAHAHLPATTNFKMDVTLNRARGGHWRVLSIDASGDKAELGRFVHGVSLDHFSVSATAPTTKLTLDANGSAQGVHFRINGISGTLDLITGNATAGPVDLSASLATDTLTLRGALSRQDGAVAIVARSALRLPDPAILHHVFQVRAPPAIGATGELTLSARDGSFTSVLDAATLSIGAADFPPSRLTASLADRAHLLVQVALAGSPSWLTWREDLTAAPFRALLTLDGHDLPAAPLSALATGRAIVAGRLTVRAALRGDAVGSGLDDRTITGPIQATLLDATLDPGLTRHLLGPILHAARLPTLGGFERLDCMTGSGAFRGGTLVIDHFALDSPALTMTGSGSVGVPSGSLDVHVKPTLRLGATDIATDIVLGGTIDTPTAALEPGYDGRFGIQIGRRSSDSAACGGHVPGRRKPPKPADFLRALGLLH